MGSDYFEGGGGVREAGGAGLKEDDLEEVSSEEDFDKEEETEVEKSRLYKSGEVVNGGNNKETDVASEKNSSESVVQGEVGLEETKQPVKCSEVTDQGTKLIVDSETNCSSFAIIDQVEVISNASDISSETIEEFTPPAVELTPEEPETCSEITEQATVHSVDSPEPEPTSEEPPASPAKSSANQLSINLQIPALPKKSSSPPPEQLTLTNSQLNPASPSSPPPVITERSPEPEPEEKPEDPEPPQNYEEEPGDCSPPKLYKRNSVNYNCSFCPFQTKIKYQFAAHMKSHQTPKIYQCKICGAQFPNHFFLNSHARVHKPGYIPGKPKSPKKLLDPDLKTEPDFPETKPEVPLTPRSARFRQNYHTLHHGPTPAPSRKRSASASLDHSPVETPTIPVELKPSGSPLKQTPLHDGPLHFRRIIRRIVKVKPFKCGQCPYSAMENVSLALHVKLVHEGVVPHKCAQCWKSFPTQLKLEDHLAESHSSQTNETSS